MSYGCMSAVSLRWRDVSLTAILPVTNLFGGKYSQVGGVSEERIPGDTNDSMLAFLAAVVERGTRPLPSNVIGW